MESVCGVNCDECQMNKKCKGCKKTNGCPFGKQCFIAKYILVGDKDKYNEFEKQLIDEFNSLNIEGMKKVDKLHPLLGSVINIEYELPNGKKVKFLDDNEIYLGNQIECEFNTDEIKTYFGLVANASFLLVSEYDETGKNPNIVIYKRR